VITWRFTPGDVARVRFAFSPLWELVFGLVVLRTPARHSLHLPWITTARQALADLDLDELFALVPGHGFVADFLAPPPTSPLPDFVEELDLVRATPDWRLVADAADVPGVPDAVLNRICADPGGAAERIADTLRSCWDLAFAEYWPRVRALLTADVLWRSRRLAEGGAHALFEDLHETVVWQGDHLTVTDACDYSGALADEGLLLVPSAMAWPDVRKMVRPCQPCIAYPVRGIATLWETGRPPSPKALAALLGRTRTRLLIALAEPNSTSTLAVRLGVTAGAVSQHLAVLLASGLVTRTRVGRFMLYHRTARADTLVDPADNTAQPDRVRRR
jgi:DNA-binding transcriptional ArsR family regulator